MQRKQSIAPWAGLSRKKLGKQQSHTERLRKEDAERRLPLRYAQTMESRRSGVVCKCYLANSKARLGNETSHEHLKLQGYCGGGRMVAPSFPLLTVDSPTSGCRAYQKPGQCERI